MLPADRADKASGRVCLFMVEGHVTDSAGMETIRRFLVAQTRLPKQSGHCALHKQEVTIRDDGSKIVMRGCCREAVCRVRLRVCLIIACSFLCGFWP